MKNTVFAVNSNMFGKSKSIMVVADSPAEALRKAKVRYGINKGVATKLPLRKTEKA